MGGTTKFRNDPISVVLLKAAKAAKVAKAAKAAKAAKVAKAAKASTVMCHCRWRFAQNFASGNTA